MPKLAYWRRNAVRTKRNAVRTKKVNMKTNRCRCGKTLAWYDVAGVGPSANVPPESFVAGDLQMVHVNAPERGYP